MAASVAVAVVLLGGCHPDAAQQPGDKASASDSPGTSESPTPSPSASSVASPTPEAAPRGARAVSEQTDLYQFEYSYPAAAGNISELASLLDKWLDNTRTQLADEAAEGRRTARENGFPYNKYSSETSWKVVGNTARYLSLGAEIASYSGGAHGNYGFDSLVWDKQDKRRLKPNDFFTSSTALEAALKERLCHALDAERAKRRPKTKTKTKADPKTDSKTGKDTAGFTDCPAIDQGTVLLETRYNHHFNRIGVEFGPYVAGPYSEGTYKFTFRVDRKVLDAVKPEYRDAFSARN